MQIEEFHYRTQRPGQGSHPGFHRSPNTGVGMVFSSHTSLLNSPDPRRVDIRASLCSPFEEIMVRQYRQNITMPVCAIADLSASLGRGRGDKLNNNHNRRKLDLLADFSSSLAYSAYRTGDPFAFIGCDDAVRDELSQSLSNNKSTAHVVSKLIRSHQPAGSSSKGLLDAAERLPARQSLVFLISDFYFSIELLQTILDALTSHSVIPVILEDSREGMGFHALRAYGLTRVTDSETGITRTLFMRPALRQRIRDAYINHRDALISAFQSRGISPLFITDHFSADEISRYFLDSMPA